MRYMKDWSLMIVHCLIEMILEIIYRRYDVIETETETET